MNFKCSNLCLFALYFSRSSISFAVNTDEKIETEIRFAVNSSGFQKIKVFTDDEPVKTRTDLYLDGFQKDAFHCHDNDRTNKYRFMKNSSLKYQYSKLEST